MSSPGEFETLVAPHRDELLRHCYRMLGSPQEPRTPSRRRCTRRGGPRRVPGPLGSAAANGLRLAGTLRRDASENVLLRYVTGG